MEKYIYNYSGGIYTYTYSDGTVVEIPVLPKSLKQAITPQPKEDKDNDQSRKRSRKEKTESSSRT